MIGNIIDKMLEFNKELEEHLLWEEQHVQSILRKYIPLELQKQILLKVWNITNYNDWKIFIPWVLRYQPKINQRILFLKTLLWSMPERSQMIGLIVYRGINDVMWSQIKKELPEIIPRGIKGWRRQY